MNGHNRPATPRWGDDPTPTCINNVASREISDKHAGAFVRPAKPRPKPLPPKLPGTSKSLGSPRTAKDPNYGRKQTEE